MEYYATYEDYLKYHPHATYEDFRNYQDEYDRWDYENSDPYTYNGVSRTD